MRKRIERIDYYYEIYCDECGEIIEFGRDVPDEMEHESCELCGKDMHVKCAKIVTSTLYNSKEYYCHECYKKYRQHIDEYRELINRCDQEFRDMDQKRMAIQNIEGKWGK